MKFARSMGLSLWRIELCDRHFSHVTEVIMHNYVHAFAVGRLRLEEQMYILGKFSVTNSIFVARICI